MVRIKRRTSLRNRMIHQRPGTLRDNPVSFTRGEGETKQLVVRGKVAF